MNRFAILLNGELTVTDGVRRQLDGVRVAAADGGIVHSDALGVEPEVWIGDFDSSRPEQNERWSKVPRITHPKDKNDTDGALAIAWCLEHGAREIVLIGAQGGRSDQVVGHFTQMIGLARRGVKCFCTNGVEEVWPLVDDRLQFDNFAIGTVISVVGLSDLTGLTMSGVKWPVKNAEVGMGSTLTLSNIVTANVVISARNGYGLVIIEKN